MLLLTFPTIQERLAQASSPMSGASFCPEQQRRPSAVAMILRNGGSGLEVLFIERARHPRDPWSGNIGFPGGRFDETDSSLRHTAERETDEEVGITLATSADYLGRLPDIVGANLPVRVSCFVYGLGGDVQTVLSDEVQDLFWTPLSHLISPQHHAFTDVHFGDVIRAVPAINLGYADKPVLWGITYRLVGQFCQRVVDSEYGPLPFLPHAGEQPVQPISP